MGNTQQILVIPQDFKTALNEFKSLINELEKAEEKIISSNDNLKAAWEGESGNEFAKQVTIVEEIFSKDVESLKEILEAKLEYAFVNIQNQDMFQSNLINKSILKNNGLINTVDNTQSILGNMGGN